MTSTNIYEDIAARTGGDIYLGVVGPVRSGKSTFIKRFLELLVLPHVSNHHEADRLRDEMPQSAQGKTVMTVEPKFIPDEAVEITLNGSTRFRVKLADCVGFLIPDALGNFEDGAERMVHTPWQAEPMAFEDAARLGTQKVIREHATVGVLVTTDGSIGEFPRENYIPAEEETVAELQAAGKPFVIICNSKTPQEDASVALALEMEERYGAPVALVNCLDLDADDIARILELVLYEFPIREISLRLPEWLQALPQSAALPTSVRRTVLGCAEGISKLSDIHAAFCKDTGNDAIRAIAVDTITAADGCARLTLKLRDGLFYETVRAETGLPIDGERELLATLRELAAVRASYAHIEQALKEAEEKGYGIVMPGIEDLHLEEPEIVKQSAGYGVRLKASAPSIHMIKADIQAEVSPIVGTEQQSMEIVKYLLHEFEEDPTRLWETNLFGKSLHELINEGLHQKLQHMPDDARQKLADTVGRIINEGSGGLICILL